MLKIKDNVDLKELEKYGFKPKYDEDSGIINRYKHRNIEFVYVCINDRELVATDSKYEEQKPVNDLLYDLIKDDLVEKVKE